MHVRHTSALAALLACLTVTPSAFADKKECAQSYVEAQKAMKANTLKKARDQLRMCARDDCMAAVRKDCIAWLDEVNAGIPSVVIEAKDHDGKETFDVRLLVNGTPIANKLDVQAMDLDPGTYRFRFESDGEKAVEQEVVLRQGQKNKIVTVKFGGALDTKRSVLEPPPEPAKRSATLPLILGGVSVVALGGAAFFWVSAESKRDDLDNAQCAPACNPDDVDTVKRDRLIGDILLGVGVVAAGVAVYMLLTPSSSPKSTALVWTPTGAAVRF